MNLACSIALSTAQIVAGVGLVVSSVASLRADKIVAASSSAYFRSSVIGFSRVVVRVEVGKLILQRLGATVASFKVTTATSIQFHAE
jgi:hypothetical protein